MVTVHRESGFRFTIFMDDHEPAHVHVGGDGNAKINLLGPNGRPEVVWSTGMTRVEVRRALRIVAERQAEFLIRWRAIHG